MEMKTLKLALLSLVTVAFIGCGGGGGGGDSAASTTNQPQTRILHKGESDTLKKGDKVKALTDDTQLNIVTDADTLQSTVTVLEGEAEVTKYN